MELARFVQEVQFQQLVYGFKNDINTVQKKDGRCSEKESRREFIIST
jgi:hypothetical protein